MQQTVTIRTRIETLNPAAALPVLLGVNTLVLFALDQAGAIPSWLKTAAAILLAF